MITFLRNVYRNSRLQLSFLLDPVLQKQMKDHTKIPIIIISFNQLEYMKMMVSFFQNRNFENIVIIDNASTYPPLLEYLKQIENEVTVEYLKENKGHRAFFDTKELVKKYAKGFYFLSDPDIVPNKNLPENFVVIMLDELLAQYNSITKVGFALDVTDIPDNYRYKEKVISWEQKYWEKEIKPNFYLADLDTSFALYKPNYPHKNMSANFYKAVRIAGSFTAKHMGWYVDSENMTDEQLYYFEKASKSSSWKLDKDGNLVGYKKDY